MTLARTPLVPSDLYRLALPSDPQIAGDGRIFYVVATNDEPTDEKRTAIWTVRDGETARPFTTGRNDRAPRVSPDGASLAFVADRGEGTRVYAMATAGGEARAITPAYDAIATLAWSPDSERIAYAAKTERDPVTAAIAVDDRTGARHIRALPFKSDDDGLLDGRREHLFVARVATGACERLTHGDFDVDALAWAPDGAHVAFAAKIDRPEASFSADLFIVASDGGEPRKLTTSRGPSLAPAFSHDGTQIAFLGHEDGDDLGGFHTVQLFVVDAMGGVARSLSATLDRPSLDYVSGDTRGTGGQQAPLWRADDAEIFVQLASEGACGIVAIARDGSGSRAVVRGERDVFGFGMSQAGEIAFAFTSPTVPSEIAWIDASGRERVLTASNPWLAERALRAPRRVRPRAVDGTTLDLWLLDPDDATDAPFVVQVHGGPHMAYGWTFMFEFQMLASHGIGVAYGNPRGSQTYGAAYATAILGDWGGIDASDVLALVDGACANASIDPKRIALAGGSYGGFMTTWLLGHCDRFAAGVSMRAVNDFVSEVGATDAGWFLEKELEAPWSDDAGRKLFERSPMRAAHAIHVPLLIEHSERDYRCAIDQGEQLFTLLRRLGRTDVEFVRFTGDGHGLSRTGKPRNRMLRLRAIAHWLIRHLHPTGIEAERDYAGALFAPLPTEPPAT